MSTTDRAARWIYRIAGIYGLLVTAPGFFLERYYGEQHPPPVTHPEFYYGFTLLVITWQVAFLVISSDPRRYRPLMPVTWVEKFGFVTVIAVLFAMKRVDLTLVGLAAVDAVLGVGFVIAWLSTRERGA